MARLFIAVWPPEDVVATLGRLRLENLQGIRFVQPANWHITLRFFGDADSDEVSRALAGTSFPPTRARIGPGIGVIAGRVLVAPVEGLEVLAAMVSERTDQIGEPPRQPFRGHLTLARAKQGASMRDARGTRVDAEFAVDEIALVSTRLDRDGARYETIESWRVG
ncbi:MAG TPA: RNA 2',3'-cyclic phosphodiesterase [Ilumatobacteraceae bacterium]|jgi:2'-5' RNA ligase|nr:RNA 2',3'-cyclic phosphodiesterase [Ilumatobacteraceae bacterium]